MDGLKVIKLIAGTALLFGCSRSSILDPFSDDLRDAIPEADSRPIEGPERGSTQPDAAQEGNTVSSPRGGATPTVDRTALPPDSVPEVVPPTMTVPPATPPADRAVVCGDDLCPARAPLPPGELFGHCCTDADECGVRLAGAARPEAFFGEECILRNQPGVADPDCPDEDGLRIGDDEQLLNIPFEGCCKSTGECGLAGVPLSLAGVACVERSYLGRILNIQGLTSISCGGEDLDADAGL